MHGNRPHTEFEVYEIDDEALIEMAAAEDAWEELYQEQLNEERSAWRFARDEK